MQVDGDPFQSNGQPIGRWHSLLETLREQLGGGLYIAYSD